MYEEKEIKYKKIKRNKTKMPKEHKIKKNYKPKKSNDPVVLAKIDWKTIFIRLGILVLFLILLIFITTRIGNQENKTNEVINKNIEYIIDSSIKYYSTNLKPQNIGDSKSKTLEEMIEENIIDKIIDKNNHECGFANSYTVFTKIKNEEYRLKVYLKCDTEDILMEKDIICEEACEEKNSSN